MLKAQHFLVILLAEACTNMPAPQASDDVKHEVDAWRGEAHALLDGQTELVYLHWAQGVPINLAETYRDHENLFSVDTSKRLLTVVTQASDADYARAVRYLRRHILTALTESQLATASDPVSDLESQSMIALDGQTYPYVELQALLTKETDAGRRRRLYDAASPVADKLNAAHQAVDGKVNEVAHHLGFADSLELASELRGVDVSTLEPLARSLLDQTDAFYITTLRQVATAQVQLDAEKLTPADNPRLLQTARFDASFPEDAELTTLQTTLAAMACPLDGFTDLKLDGEKNAKKNPLPAVFPVIVPGDVRVSYEPKGGVIAYQNFFHEVGLGLVYSSTQTPWYEFKRLGSDTVRQAYGFLFQRLLSNPEWIRTHLLRLPAVEQKEYLRLQTLRQLFVARRYAAKILFELALHSGQATDPGKLYQNLLSRAYGYRVDEAAAGRWALDHDPLFESVPVFRAWLLEATIDAQLDTNYGDRWFERKEASTFLRQMWSQGEKPTAEELLEQLHTGPLSVGPFVQRLKRRLN